MNKPALHERIKGKIFTGFSLLLFLVLAAVYVIIQIASQLTPPDTGVSQSVTKLSIVSNMLSTLIDADGQARAYITTGRKVYLSQYETLENNIRNITDSLKTLSIDDQEQYNRMAVVDSLLDLKKSALDNYFRIRLSGGSAIISPERLQNIVDHFSDTIAVSSKILALPGENKENEVTTSEPAKKETLLKRLWSNITGKQSKTDSIAIAIGDKIQNDTLQTYTRLNDSAINLIRAQLLMMSEEERVERQLAIERELLLLRTDQYILDEIRNVLLLFEKEEINRAIAGAENSRAVLKKLWNTALIAAILGILTILIFTVLIWKDLARSNFYRKKLEEARALAEKLLKVKEMFLANMSHEIRTPITSIIGFSEQLSSTRLSNTQSKYLRYINSSSEHLLKLIDDLLDFSRIESGKLSLQERHFYPSNLIKDAFETMYPRARLKGLEARLIMEIDPEIKVSGDDLRIRQILFNLLNNSIKFTSAGKVTVKAQAETNGEIVTLFMEVADTGIGIQSEKQQEIFNEFTQVDAGITRKYGGSGLGLAISKKLTEMMKGQIVLSSTPGEGTTVLVTIPLQIYTGIIKSVAEAEEKKIPDLSGFRILIAEDDETTRMLITEILLETGAKVTETDNGQSAWDVFAETEGDFDLIITDIQMPGLSGPELSEKIHEWSGDNQIKACPILGLTAHATGDDISRYRESGMTEILLKPFKQHSFHQTLIQLLEVENVGIKKNKPEITGNTPDLTVFNQFANNDPEALKKIIVSLADGLKDTSTALEIASEEKDYIKISLLAHRILPNLRNLKAKNTVVKLLELENFKKSGHQENEKIEETLVSAIDDLKKIEIDLRNLIAELH
ncbi:MAG: two-component system sensor histidine kinase/response regulator [Bacteroidetes bacterium]|nr:MAG: two-component system sensor histidine kinase/response regulator [Bacteroidota bacterium]